MKRLLVVLLCLVLVCAPCFAESTDAEAALAEKDARIAELEQKISELQAQLEQLSAAPEPTPEPTPAPYEMLKKGSKGDSVVKLQERLKALGYLSGKSDGSFGSGTASAVKEFQKTAGLAETGEADVQTQETLYSEDAPASQTPVFDTDIYEKLDYKSNSRDPDAYSGKKIKFSGKIIQVMEDSGYAVFRIATKGSYDNVVYCLYEIPDTYKRFLEDDKVMVYAVSTGIYTYETIMGGSITIPACVIERIELK